MKFIFNDRNRAICDVFSHALQGTLPNLEVRHCNFELCPRTSSANFPQPDDLIGLPRILATIPSITSHKFEGALFPIELANGIASMSSFPSAKILQRFMESV